MIDSAVDTFLTPDPDPEPLRPAIPPRKRKQKIQGKKVQTFPTVTGKSGEKHETVKESTNGIKQLINQAKAQNHQIINKYHDKILIWEKLCKLLSLLHNDTSWTSLFKSCSSVVVNKTRIVTFDPNPVVQR